jgi:hypothetical protein
MGEKPTTANGDLAAPTIRGRWAGKHSPAQAEAPDQV